MGARDWTEIRSRVKSTDMKLNELAVGKAGEYLVCADRILAGMIAFPAEWGLPYDVVVQDGNRMIRVQVKTTQHPRATPQRVVMAPAYLFNIRRTGRGGVRRYQGDEFDVLALVALDVRQIGYMVASEMPQSLVVRCESHRGLYQSERTTERIEQARRLIDSGLTIRDAAKRLGDREGSLAKLLRCRGRVGTFRGQAGCYLSDLPWPERG
jgi:hypothetical protein